MAQAPVYFTRFLIEQLDGFFLQRTFCNIPYRILIIQQLGIIRRYGMGKADCGQVVKSQRGFALSELDVEEMKPYINALEFEPYNEADMTEEQLREENDRGPTDMYGYFKGITDSWIPLVKIPMNGSNHFPLWPTEILSKYLYDKYHI